MKRLIEKSWAAVAPRLARLSLARQPRPVVAITGSVGKSTTTAFITEVIATQRRVGATRSKNVGTPLASVLLDVPHTRRVSKMAALLPRVLWRAFVRPPALDCFVLEVGTGRPGQLKDSLRAFMPTVAVYTTIGNAHLGNYPNFEALVEEKATLISALPPDGVAVLRSDDPIVRGLAARHSGRSVFYGFDESADVRMSSPVARDGRVTVTLRDGAGELVLSFRHLHEKPHLYAVMAAWTVGLVLGLPRSSMQSVVEHLQPLPGRGRVTTTADGTVIIDDSHNASPVAVIAALESLTAVGQGRRRVAVLGDMREIGEISAEAHRTVGAAAAERVDVLVAVGDWRHELANGFGARPGCVFLYPTVRECLADLSAWAAPGDAVLVKGSRAMNLQWIARALRG